MPAASHPAVEAHNLVKRFDGTCAVDGISFSVRRGTTFGLLGINGAGKTTTLMMLLGLLRPDGGVARVLGIDMARDRYRVLPRANFSSPYVELPHRLTPRENLRVYGEIYGVRNIRERVEKIASELEFEDFLDRPLGKLSTGQKARVGLAKALVNEPEILFLDEPTASLDPERAAWMRDYLLDYQRRTGATLVLASHNMPEVERMCGAVVILSQGCIISQGTPDELRKRHGAESLEDVFLDIARKGKRP